MSSRDNLLMQHPEKSTRLRRYPVPPARDAVQAIVFVHCILGLKCANLKIRFSRYPEVPAVRMT